MKSFKEFLEKTNWLNWDSSHAAVRDKVKLPEPTKTTKKPIKESVKESTYSIKESVDDKIQWEPWPNDIKKANQAIHEDHHIKPDLSNTAHNDAIHHYCGTDSKDSENGHCSSSNMNNHLRYLAGQKVAEGGENTQGIVGGHSPEKVRDSVRKFTDAFNERTVNRKAVKVYAGVPTHIGEMIEKSAPGTIHVNPGAQSTTSTKYVANSYGDFFAKEKGNNVNHVMQIHLHPGAGRSAYHVSPFPEEHEFVIPPGAHLKYSHTTVHEKDPNDFYAAPVTKVHHLEALPERTKMEDYPNYPK